ncbi:MAG: type II toxin-antitoxin system VapC family toxin [Spirochaetaceae bacterium]
MIGADTSFLVAFEIREHRLHKAAVAFAHNRKEEGFALAPQVLAEFIHVVTDSRRLESPLEMSEALDRAEAWWEGREVTQLFPASQGTRRFLDWMKEFGLGRKRILDTQLAALYHSNGVTAIVTTDARDFARFPEMAPILLQESE